MKIKKLEWSEHLKGNKECRYDHVKAETPFGIFWITWKSWKEWPSYDLEIRSLNIYIHCLDVEDGKKKAQEWIEKKVLECIIEEI